MQIELYGGPMDGMQPDVQELSNPILVPIEVGLFSTAYAVYERDIGSAKADYRGMNYKSPV